MNDTPENKQNHAYEPLPAKKKARVMKASHLLQSKVGFGEVEEEAVERGEKVIQAISQIDFKPLLTEYLEALEDAIAAFKKETNKDQEDVNNELHESITAPVMQIKGNAAMFNYILMSKLANIMLNFLETVDKIDDDVIDILEAHLTTLHAIVNKDMRDDGGVDGQLLQDELRDACKRYFTKHAIAGTLNFDALLE